MNEALTVAINTCALLGGFALARRHRSGWLLAIAATLIGAALNARLGLVSGLAFNALGLVVNVRGYRAWARETRQPAEPAG